MKKEKNHRVVVHLMNYWNVMRKYPIYRTYFFSHVCQNMGDWFVRIASILVVEEFSSSGKTLSHLALSVRTASESHLCSSWWRYFRSIRSTALYDILGCAVWYGRPGVSRGDSLSIITYDLRCIRPSFSFGSDVLSTGMVPLLV
jgi:hypothetical protein